jgi:hypothetical protein
MGNNGNSFTDYRRNGFIDLWEHSLCLTNRNTATISWHDLNDNWGSISCDFRNIAFTEKNFLFPPQENKVARSSSNYMRFQVKLNNYLSNQLCDAA